MRFFRKTSTEDQFSAWIKEHNAVLYKHAFWLCGNQALAADMVQETYIQAWQSLKGLRDQDKVLPWLLTILRRNIYKEQREAYRNKEAINYLKTLEEEHSSGEISLVDLYSAFDSISDSQRETLLLYVLHGLTYEEISDQLDIPVGTVMSRISRARKAIKVFLGFDSDNITRLNSFIRKESQ